MPKDRYYVQCLRDGFIEDGSDEDRRVILTGPEDAEGNPVRLYCDADQIFPEEPGMGTPRLIEYRGETMTLDCAGHNWTEISDVQPTDEMGHWIQNEATNFGDAWLDYQYQQIEAKNAAPEAPAQESAAVKLVNQLLDEEEAPIPADPTDGPDFRVSGGGTVYLVTPQNEAAAEHLRSNVGDEARWLGKGLAVEHSYIGDLVDGLRQEGFTVS